jgi:hypothetical protein
MPPTVRPSTAGALVDRRGRRGRSALGDHLGAALGAEASSSARDQLAGRIDILHLGDVDVLGADAASS